MSKFFTRLASVVAACALFSQTASADTTASQTFTLVVPDCLSITAPPPVTMTHDQTNNPQAFPAQVWTVKGNCAAGMHVNFATSQAFVHTTNSSMKRDAKLSLALGTVTGPASWTINVPTDQTDYIINDPIAQVSASSNNAGQATFLVSVTFVGGTFEQFTSGNYVTTVVGTVAAN